VSSQDILWKLVWYYKSMRNFKPEMGVRSRIQEVKPVIVNRRCMDIDLDNGTIQHEGPFDNELLGPGEEVGSFLRLKGNMHKELVYGIWVEYEIEGEEGNDEALRVKPDLK
jgi:hypothetical protein